MSSFFKSSIGQKLLMSLSGLFLITFLAVHLLVNSMLLFDSSGDLYNQAANFMGTNPFMHVMEPVLALGFILHIVYSFILSLQNKKARGPERYYKVNQSQSSTWASRNMLVLGGIVLVFMAIHLIHFFVPMKFGGMEDYMVTIDGVEMQNAYLLVTSLFEIWYYDLLYVVGAVLLALHLGHGFWSAFQTIGWSNDIWRKRLTVIGKIVAVTIGFGYAIIPIYFLITSL